LRRRRIAEIDGVIQQTASRAQESAASEELKRQAKQARSLVDELGDVVDGR